MVSCLVWRCLWLIWTASNNEQPEFNRAGVGQEERQMDHHVYSNLLMTYSK